MIRLLRGDCRETLSTLEPGSVQTCITSVPYYQLRSYLAADDPLKPFEIGLEKTPELWLAHLSHAFHEVRRVLRDDGTLWVNCGDSMAGSGNGSNDHRQQGKHFRKGEDSLSLNADKYKGQKPGTTQGLPAKNLMMMPSRLAMALQSDGWILRSMIPWVKRSAMPESVTDRPSTAVEYWFLFSKEPRYYWDADAVRVDGAGRTDLGNMTKHSANRLNAGGPWAHTTKDISGRNRRNSDWFFESWQGLMQDEIGEPLALMVNPAGYAGAHFATFPPALVEPCIKASTRPGDTVLDPFAGAGTVGLVADRLGRNAVLCELSAPYSVLAEERLTTDSPMFVELESA